MRLNKKLKREGHELIDRIVALGFERNEVYRKLRKKLKCRLGKEHFSNMTTQESAEAIKQLRFILSNKLELLERKNRPPKVPKEKSKYHPVILPLAQQREAYAKLKKKNTKNFFQKLLCKFF